MSYQGGYGGSYGGGGGGGGYGRDRDDDRYGGGSRGGGDRYGGSRSGGGGGYGSPQTQRPVQMGKLDEELAVHITKALSTEESAPKQKHVRSCIVYTWDIKGSGNIWAVLRQFPMHGDEVVILKALITTHKIINGGHPSALKDIASDHNWIYNLNRNISSGRSGYGSLIKAYTEFLNTKLEYHRLHPEFSGSFDYQEYVTLKGIEDPNEGFETINELLELLKKVDRLAEVVFSGIRGVGSEVRIACLVPLVEESYGIYQFLVNMLMAMHQIIGASDVLSPLRERFNGSHYALLKFYYECSGIPYLTSLVTVPKLDRSPPDFLSAGPPSLQSRRAPSPPRTPARTDSDADIKKQQAELEAQIRAENARNNQKARDAELELQRQMENQLKLDNQQRQHEQQRMLDQQRQLALLEQQRMGDEERMRQAQQLAMQQQHQALENQIMQSKLIDSQTLMEQMRQQNQRDRNLIDQYEDKVRQLEQQVSTLSMMPKRDDDLVRRLQDEVAQWKQKYEALAKLYAQLRKEHLELLNKFKDVKDNSSRMADDVRQDLEKARNELRAKHNELTNIMIERDKLRGDAERLRLRYDEELARLRKELSDAKDSLVDMSKSKGAEVSGVIARFNAEKAELEKANLIKQQAIDDLRRRLDQSMADLQRGKAAQSEETAILQQGLDQTLLALSQLQKTQQETEASLLAQIQRLQADHLELLNRMMDSILQSCIVKIEEAVYELESPAHEGNQTASPEYVQTLMEKAATNCSDVGASFIRLVQGGDQSGAISTSNALAHSIAQLLHNTKGVTRLAKDDNVEKAILDAGRNVALNGRTLFDRLKSAAMASIDASRRSAYIEGLTRDAVIGIFNLGPLMDRLAPEVKIVGDLGDAVEREMQAAARAIEEAAKRLQELLYRPPSGADLNVHSAVLQSAVALTNAIQQLIRCATACQQEIAAQGKGTSSMAAFYKKNNKWTEGLVSAAKAVAVATTYLVEVADGLVRGTHSMEQLIVAAQEVGVATTQLVASSRVKAVPGSKLQEKLEEAAVAVREATKLLVKAAKDAAKLQSEKDARDEIGKMGMHEVKIREMEQQVKILELEKELNQARYKLGEIRKQGYAE